MVPVHAGPKSDKMSPNKLLATTTSKNDGRCTKCALKISMWNLSCVSSGYFFAISTTRSSQYGIEIEMPLDFVALVMCFFGRL